MRHPQSRGQMGSRYSEYLVPKVSKLNNKLYFLPVEGQSASEIRALNWSENPLGPPEFWPVQLKTAVQMMLASHFPKAIVWGEKYITLFNDAFRPILGDKSNCMGTPFNEIWAEVWHEIEPILLKAYQGEATFIEEFPLVINRYGYPEQCYFTFCYSPILDDTGTVIGIIDTVIEMTGKVESVKNASILNAELAHRIKNTFSVVQALATQTFKTKDIDETLPIFVRRLHALSSAHDVLRVGKISNGTITQIVHGVVEALSVKDRILLKGPPILIGPKGALSTSLLINELMTNALKYGALSVPDGHVSVEWRVEKFDDEINLIMEWVECNGPQVEAPSSQGFGSKLINMGLLGVGGAKTFYKPNGFTASFTAPFKQIQEEGRLYSSVE